MVSRAKSRKTSAENRAHAYATLGQRTLDGVLSHEQIGALLGLSRARVQQIEAQALRKMRRAVRRGDW